MWTQINPPSFTTKLEQNKTIHYSFLSFNYQMRNGSRTYLLNIKDPTSPMQSKLCHEAYVEISANKHKKTKTRITESIDMKLCTWSRNPTIWTNNIHIGKKSISVLKNVEERYNQMPWCCQVPSNSSLLSTHFLLQGFWDHGFDSYSQSIFTKQSSKPI